MQEKGKKNICRNAVKTKRSHYKRACDGLNIQKQNQCGGKFVYGCMRVGCMGNKLFASWIGLSNVGVADSKYFMCVAAHAFIYIILDFFCFLYYTYIPLPLTFHHH